MGPQLTTTIAWYEVAIAPAFGLLYPPLLFSVPYSRQRFISGCEQARVRIEADERQRFLLHRMPIGMAVFAGIAVLLMMLDTDSDRYFQHRRGHLVLALIAISRSDLVGTSIKVAFYSFLLTTFEVLGILDLFQSRYIARKARKQKTK